MPPETVRLIVPSWTKVQAAFTWVEASARLDDEKLAAIVWLAWTPENL